ncbi:juvenile hormone esterase [Microplitis demolitor]|uniref:juvenile hormone esterase n=1 Tax=Microplitis demolitor TaxID=69319 RepID=UPI0004CCE635|nr:juvenile hormone esterase [Microplitis demolitor]
MYLSFLIILFLLINYSYQLVPSEIIKTHKGLVQGKIETTVVKKIKYSYFAGIPYAKPPIGYLRFKPPVEVDDWEGVLNTTKESSVCPQWDYDENHFAGREDCLYLNVYTPKISSNDTKLRAVMVWIYGGAFVTGYINSSRYGPDFIIEEDVILVAMNYRLGALGFLSLEHKNATGNAGLKDQNFALWWVKRNIIHFGGDPDKVTIFGQSAGSASVGFHVLSDLSTGLFNGAIYMSGTPLNLWAFYRPDQAVSRSFYLGKILGVKTTDKTVLLKKLYSVTAKDIILATKNMTLLDLPFNPTIENTEVTDKPFLNECSLKKYKSGDYNKVPQIIGFVGIETLSFASSVSTFIQVVNDTIDELTDIPLLREIEDVNVLDDILAMSLSSLGDLTDDVIYAALNITTDILFKDGIDRTQYYIDKSSEAPIYYYQNKFDYPEAIHKVEGNFLNGTAHSDDIAHIFWVSNKNQSLDPNSQIFKQRNKMVRMWTNFAKYGNPTPNASDPILNITWPPSGSAGTCLEINNNNYFVGERPISPLLKAAQLLIDPLRSFDNGCSSSIL